MLRVSKLADYGTVIMTQLARSRGNLLNAKDISIETRIPLPTVSKVLKILSQASFLTSHRGVKGGYGLSRPPEAINLAEIVIALDGGVALTECSFVHGQCQVEPYCSIRHNWRLINDVLCEALETISLAELAKPLSATTVRGNIEQQVKKTHDEINYVVDIGGKYVSSNS